MILFADTQYSVILVLNILISVIFVVEQLQNRFKYRIYLCILPFENWKELQTEKNNSQIDRCR